MRLKCCSREAIECLMQRGCSQVSGSEFWLLRRMGGWGRGTEGAWGREKSLNVCVLFFLPPVKDEKRHAVKDAFDFSASFFFQSHCLFFFPPLFSREAGMNCILIMFG